jgi:hypothetical protein
MLVRLTTPSIVRRHRRELSDRNLLTDAPAHNPRRRQRKRALGGSNIGAPVDVRVRDRQASRLGGKRSTLT